MNKIYFLLIVWLASASIDDVQAQNERGQFDLTVPSVGVLFPLADVVESGAISTGSPAADHEVSVVFGSRLTYWFIPEMAAELELVFSPSALKSDAFGMPGTVDAQFFVLSGRLVYDFGSDQSNSGFLLTGGLGLFGTSYNEFDMTTGGLGLLGIGYRIRLDNALSLRLDLTDYITTTNWELADGSETDQLLQTDLVLSAGLVITLNKKK